MVKTVSHQVKQGVSKYEYSVFNYSNAYLVKHCYFFYRTLSKEILIGYLLTHQMLRLHREAVIKVKAGLMKVLIQLAMGYPEPTLENVLHPNSKVLIGKWKKFFKNVDCPQRTELFRAIERLTVCEHEHDNAYRDFMNWFVGELYESVQSGEWKLLETGKPKWFWNENKGGTI